MSPSSPPPQVSHLTALDLSANCLPAAPPGLELCLRLQSLSLAENKIQVWTGVFFGLGDLRTFPWFLLMNYICTSVHLYIRIIISMRLLP